MQFRAGNAHSTRKRKRCLSATEIEHEAEHRVKRQQEAERHEVALDTEGSTADDTSVTTAKQKPTALRAPSMLSSAADLASISRIGAMPTVEDEEVEALLNTLSVRERESQRVLQAALDLSVQPTFRERSTANRVRLAELSHLVANHPISTATDGACASSSSRRAARSSRSTACMARSATVCARWLPRRRATRCVCASRPSLLPLPPWP